MRHQEPAEEGPEWQPEWSKKHGGLARNAKKEICQASEDRRPSYSSTGSHDLPENSRLKMMQDLDKAKVGVLEDFCDVIHAFLSFVRAKMRRNCDFSSVN